jgi:hypothetical protein
MFINITLLLLIVLFVIVDVSRGETKLGDCEPDDENEESQLKTSCEACFLKGTLNAQYVPNICLCFKGIKIVCCVCFD